jgi:FlaA1/EpsC-like NDP-sugar epimerase
LPDTVDLLQRGEENLSDALRDIRVEDLLGRDPVSFDFEQISAASPIRGC